MSSFLLPCGESPRAARCALNKGGFIALMSLAERGRAMSTEGPLPFLLLALGAVAAAAAPFFLPPPPPACFPPPNRDALMALCTPTKQPLFARYSCTFARWASPPTSTLPRPVRSTLARPRASAQRTTPPVPSTRLSAVHSCGRSPSTRRTTTTFLPQLRVSTATGMPPFFVARTVKGRGAAVEVAVVAAAVAAAAGALLAPAPAPRPTPAMDAAAPPPHTSFVPLPFPHAPARRPAAAAPLLGGGPPRGGKPSIPIRDSRIDSFANSRAFFPVG